MPTRSQILNGCLAILAAAIVAAAQPPAAPEFEKGRVIDKVTVAADPSQSYALFLPTSYDPAKKSPIIYIFDPAGRGAVAVEKYRVAAEKYGYIALATNSSRNGLDLNLLKAVINNLSADTDRRFQIDGNRVLAAGLSGGARVASFFAASCRSCIFGVIGSAAGFLPGIEVTAGLSFIFFGTTTHDDFNYPELNSLDKKLTAARVAHRIELFEGGHEWLPEALSIEALAWFEIRAMKAGRRPKDEAMIDEQFKARVSRADSYLAAKNYAEAYAAFAGIVDDFSGWRDVSAFAEKAKSLETSPELKKARKAEADEERMQVRISSELMALKENISDPEQRADARSQLHSKIADLHKDAGKAVDTVERRVARRTLSQVFIEIMEAQNQRGGSGNMNLALENLDIAAELNPKSPQVSYNRAKVLASLGDKKKALDALVKAFELGFKDLARIASEKAFDPLRNDERFIRLTSPK